VTFTPTHFKVALALSLGLNFALAGLWAGRVIERRRQPPPMAMNHPRPRGPWRGVVEHRGAQGFAMRAARAPVRAALMAEPFDPAALEKALAELRQKTSVGQEKVHAALVDVAKRATPAERRELADSFELRRRRPRR
jgi:uncharacterized membrane protein